MPCCVAQCPGSTRLVRFPAVAGLRERWHEAIRIGTGSQLPNTRRPLELCVSHFAKDPETASEEEFYQEPTRFVDCTGNSVKIGSCRLCHRVAIASELFPLKSQVADEFRIGVVLSQQSVLKVVLSEVDFLQLICQECLVRVELIRSIQSAFYFKNVTFKEWQKKLPQLEVIVEKEARRNEQPVADSDLLDEDSIVGFTIDRANPLRKQRKPEAITNLVTEDPKKVKKIIKKKKPLPEPFPTERTSKCYICRLQFHDRDDLLEHLKQDHAAKPKYACSECKGRSTKIAAYNVHLSWHDVGERPVKCRSCELRFVTRRGRTVHERRDHDRPGKNKILKKKSSQRQALRFVNKVK